MAGIIDKIVEKHVLMLDAQASYFFMLVAFLWLCWKIREMRVRPKYLAEREIIKRIAKDIACGKEKKRVVQNVHRYRDLFSRRYKVKKRNLMKDEQFLRFAMVRYLMDSEDTRDSVFEEYANELERGSETQGAAIWKVCGGYYLAACAIMVVIVAGSVFFGFSKSPFAVLAPDEMVIYAVLCLLCKSPRAQAAGAARLAGFTARTGAQCPRSGRLCVEFIMGGDDSSFGFIVMPRN